MDLPRDVETWVRLLTFVPIVLCSVIGLGLALAKWFQVRRPNRLPDRLFSEVRQMVKLGELKVALEVTETDNSRAARLLRHLLSRRGRSREIVKERVVQAGSQIARELEYGLGGLSLIATLGPLFGLLGTVVGIVLIFSRLAAAGGVATAQQLAGGIGTALYTTVTGLLVGILAIAVDAEGAVFFGEEAVNLDELSVRLEALFNKDETSVLLAADARVSHGSVIEIMDRVRRAGIYRLSIETVRRSDIPLVP